MSAILHTNAGDIIYSEDYIATLAGAAATECYGVVGMSAKKVWDSVADILGQENVKKGVKVYTDNTNAINILGQENVKKGVKVYTDNTNAIKVELNIIVEYGTSISVLGDNIISAVRYRLEQFTGLVVKDVNVIISGIRI